MITRKAGPALAAGCTMVLKPASQTPFSALALAALAELAGLPTGVFNVVTGPAAEIGAELTSNPAVRKLTFTGSTEIGRQLMQQCAKDIKKVSLELGGNAPFIVFDDADLDAAVEGALICKYRNNGQTCVVRQPPVHPGRRVRRVRREAEGCRRALERRQWPRRGITIGPLIDQKAVDKVQEHIADAVKRGAKLLAGGKPHALGGFFFEPTILVDVPKDAAVAREETFGPLAPLFRFSDEADVDRGGQRHRIRVGRLLLRARSGSCVPCGRGAGVRHDRHQHGDDLERSRAIRRMKASGLGREGSKYGIEDYLEIKYLCISV